MTPNPTIPGTSDGTMRWSMTLLFSLPPTVVRVPPSFTRTTLTCWPKGLESPYRIVSPTLGW